MKIENNRINSDLNSELCTTLNCIIEPKLNIIDKITERNKTIVNLIYNIEDYSNGKILFKRNKAIKLTKRRNKSLNDNDYENLKKKISSLYGFMSTKGESNFLDSIFNSSNSNNNNINNNSASLPKMITKNRYFGKSINNFNIYSYKENLYKNKSLNMKKIYKDSLNKKIKPKLFLKDSIDEIPSIISSKEKHIIKTHNKSKRYQNIFRKEISKKSINKYKGRNFINEILSYNSPKIELKNVFKKCDNQLVKAEKLEGQFIRKMNRNHIKINFKDELKQNNDIHNFQENMDDKKFIKEESKKLINIIKNNRYDRKKNLHDLDIVKKISNSLAFKNRKTYFKTFGNYTLGYDDNYFIFDNEIEKLKDKYINLEIDNIKKSHSSKIVKNLLEKTIREKELILKKCETFKI